MRRFGLLLCALLAACSRGAPPAAEPHQIRLVGSSAGLRFTAAVAEDFMRAEADVIAPLVQADGTGSGIARFCGGLGARHPDLVVATRAMTAAETARCASNGVNRVVAIPFGWSALVLVARRDESVLDLTRADLWRALAGRAAIWAAIDPRLPATPIRIHGPTPRPELADGLFDTLLRPGCRTSAGRCDGIAVRDDAAYVAHGADAALVMAAVAQTPGAIGIVPYADAAAHPDTLRLLTLDGVMPDARTILSGRYPARLPLLLLVKGSEAPAVPGMPALLRGFAAALGPAGRFASLGLVPLAPPSRASAVTTLNRIAAARL